MAEPLSTTARVVPLIEAVELNPGPDRGSIPDDLDVSFVPMAAVEAATGRMDATAIRRFGEVKKGYTVFREGDVLFAKITPCMENGKMAVARGLRNGVGCGSTEFHVLRPKPGVDAQYVYHFVSSASFRAEAAHHMTGAVGQKRVPAAFLERCEIPLPDQDEQRRIVAELERQLSRLDEAVANLKRVKANLKRYKAAVLKAAVEGRLVPTEAELARCEGRAYEPAPDLLQQILSERRQSWQGKYREPSGATDANTDGLPDGWCWCTIEQLAEVGTGATPSRSDASYWLDGDVAWVSSAVVNEPYVDAASEFVTRKALAETNLTLYPPGTLLVAMYGEGKTRGRCTELRIAATTNQAIAALQVDSRARPYLKLFLEHNYEELRKVASGGVQPNLNLGIIRAVNVPLPPLAEQQRIVIEVDRCLSVVSQIGLEIDLGEFRAGRLRQAVLSVSFVERL